MSAAFERYGESWQGEAEPLAVELEAIAMGGRWRNRRGQECGLGLFGHLMKARGLCWPRRYRHRWTDLYYQNFIENDITILMGPASTQKTSHASEYALLRYWSRPHDTMVILSTITMDKLDTGVFGEVKMLWQSARDLHPWLAGNLLEGRRAISTDSLAEDETRDLRKGIIGRPCFTGGRWVGLGVLAGTKQANIVFLADELQFMAETFTQSWPNLFSNGSVKIIGSGNPKHDPDDQLGIAAEPEEGWGAQSETKTTVWKTRFLNGKCVNVVGVDSPNLDTAEGKPEPYPGLIGRKFIERIAHDWGQDSPEYWGQAVGVMRLDMADKRVLTRLLCRQHHAHEQATWSGEPLTKVYGLDPSYGGQDACIGVRLEFGMGANGLMLVRFAGYRNIVIKMSLEQSPEDQVAAAVAEDLEAYGIPIENTFYDPYGKGTIGAAFARKFGFRVPIPVDSGGKPTNRAVREDLYVEDERTGQKRLKTCAEHYAKFVTEAWFSARYTVEADQMRELPVDVMLEGCARKYDVVGGNRIEVESKDDYKLRVKHSPNKFDALAVAIEGARQRGFVIARLGNGTVESGADDYFEREAREYRETIQRKLLVHK